MNQAQRNKLAKLCDELEELAIEEREKYDNLPEGIQGSERGEKIDEAATALETALDDLRQLTE